MYAINTTTDFTTYGAIVAGASMVLMFFSITLMFFNSPILVKILAAFGALLALVFIVIDT